MSAYRSASGHAVSPRPASPVEGRRDADASFAAEPRTAKEPVLFVTTASGRAVNLAFEQDEGAISIRDIATHLARMPRWLGATNPTPYSVAQHSCLVADAMRSDPCAALYGLLHDAHEAYMGDIAEPVRRWIEARTRERDLIGVLKQTLDRAIFEALGLAFPIPDNIAAAVAYVDQRMAATEQRDLLNDCPRAWIIEAEPFNRTIGTPWPWAKAEDEFLKRFNRLHALAGGLGDG